MNGSLAAAADTPTPSDGFEADPDVLRFDGLCSLCGATGTFEKTRHPSKALQGFPCASCKGALRQRNEAAAILDEFGHGEHVSMRSAIEDDRMKSLAVYNVGVSGQATRWLRELPDYRQSYFWDDGTPGEVRDGTHHQDLESLTFDDDAFDLVFSSHVMEHIPDPVAALLEVHRVLRPNGRYIFSVPVRWPPPPRTVVRARLVDGEIVDDVEPRRFHNSPTGGALVFTDFGTDLLETLSDVGFVATMRRPHRMIEVGHQDSVFVAIKPPSS